MMGLTMVAVGVELRGLCGMGLNWKWCWKEVMLLTMWIDRFEEESMEMWVLFISHPSGIITPPLPLCPER